MSVLCSLLLVAMAVVDLHGAEYALLLAVFPLMFAAPSAAVLLRQAARGDEVFELYEGGLAHTVGGVRRSWTWDQVRAIDVSERGPGSLTGSDVDCAIRFDDGELVRFTGLTQDCREIIGALGVHRADAASEPARQPNQRRAVTVLSLITLACAGTATWAITSTAGSTDGEANFGFAMLAVVCAVTGFFSGLFLLMTVRHGGRL